MSSGAEIRTEREARAILKLAADAPPSTWRAAFQCEVKAAHPDRGGDDERVRLVIEAYRFLKTAELQPPQKIHGRPPPRPAPQARPEPRAARPQSTRAESPPRSEPRAEPRAEAPPEPHPEAGLNFAPRRPARFRITIVEAFRGCDKTVRLTAGKRFKVRLPAGLQTGDVVRFGQDGEHRLSVEVSTMPGVELKGADLWLTVSVSAEFIKEGGRMEVETPLGPRKFWVSRTSASRGLYRAPGEGLPARTNRAKGHLYLKFELDVTLKQSPAKSLLARFAAAWATA
jgi:DnaJ-class molecular chaperone